MHISKDSIDVFKRKTKDYYDERNISLVEETAKKTLKNLKQEFDDIRELSLTDWIKLFRFYKTEFFKALRNRITFSIFLTSGKMLSRNPEYKWGKIFAYSAKILNPELKRYMGERLDKKLEKKQNRYNQEINLITKLREKNERILKGDYGDGFFRRLLNRFSR